MANCCSSSFSKGLWVYSWHAGISPSQHSPRLQQQCFFLPSYFPRFTQKWLSSWGVLEGNVEGQPGRHSQPPGEPHLPQALLCPGGSSQQPALFSFVLTLRDLPSILFPGPSCLSYFADSLGDLYPQVFVRGMHTVVGLDCGPGCSLQIAGARPNSLTGERLGLLKEDLSLEEIILYNQWEGLKAHQMLIAAHSAGLTH